MARCEYHGPITYKDDYTYWDTVVWACPHEAEPGQKLCIFHMPVESKNPQVFWDRFRRYLEAEQEEMREVPLPDKARPIIHCNGFEFPDMEGDLFYEDCIYELSFEGSVFNSIYGLSSIKYQKKVSFRYALFKQPLFLEKAHFLGGVDFFEAKFGTLSFGEFLGCTFGNATDFTEAELINRFEFADCDFIGSAVFENTITEKGISFNRSRFRGRALFRIKTKSGKPPEINFRNVETSPETVLKFVKSDLRRWSVSNTPGLEYAIFENVIWKTKPKDRKKINDEELIGAEDNGVTYESTATAYRLLRLNYERRLAYEEASDFHIGQMEMMLKNPGTYWTKKAGLCLYKAVSNFGEGVGRPILWFIGLGVAFAGFWAVKGFHYSDIDWVKLSYCHIWPWEVFRFEPDSLTWFNIGKTFVFSFKTFLTLPNIKDTAGTQLLGALQRLLGGSVITLFILALRRAFRR